MVSTRPPISNSSSSLSKRANYNSCHRSTAFPVLLQDLSICSSFRFLWFSFCDLSRRQRPLVHKFSLFVCVWGVLIIARSGLMTGILWSAFISKSLVIWCILFSRIDSVLCTYHLVVMVKFQFLAQFNMDHLPVVSSLVLLILIHRLEFCFHK